MSTFVGRRETPKATAPEAPKQELKQAQGPEPKADKTRAELVEEAEALGITVPPRASKAQIQKLIDEAPVM